jgi:uncharacterized SAM-binding protein YcdF (DUF218 family)
VKSFLKVLFILLIALGVVVAVVFFGLGFYLSPQDRLSKSDAVVAISGGETRSRALEAIRLYEEGWAPHLIFSGAALDPKGPSNARAMEQVALQAGVPRSAIELDERSANTDQNALGVADIAKREGYRKIILVTSPYHQRRASITFQRVFGSSVQILNHSTTDQNWRRAAWWSNSYSRELTISELQKTLYVLWTNN